MDTSNRFTRELNLQVWDYIYISLIFKDLCIYICYGVEKYIKVTE